jgi:hypothetical protein
VEGVDRTSAEFKQARREFNNRIRDVMVTVGNQTVLPDMRREMTGEIGERWADSLFVQRERSGVFIGSRQRGKMNRALGWLDFGGRRPMDSQIRRGPHVMVRALARHQDSIDDAVLHGLMRAFDPLDHTP